MTRTDLFSYELPTGMIAQEPLEPRDSSRLMVLNLTEGEPFDDTFRNIINHLKEGDCLVYNDSKVIPCRLLGKKRPTGAALEVLLLAEEEPDHWTALIKPSKRVRPGNEISFDPEKLWAYVEEKIAPGEWLIKLEANKSVQEALEEIGRVPLPPYIKVGLRDPNRYQTVYAREWGSAAAPTAGLHFTNDLIRKIKSKGVGFVPITLHIGLDTFKPIRCENVEDHAIHSERLQVSTEAANTINETKKSGGRIISIGTTAARAVESTGGDDGKVRAVKGSTDLFITPGYRFGVLDGMITNFHLPRSTLLVMVSAFAGREKIVKAYDRAKELGYRFFSFGDAMLIFGEMGKGK